LAGENIEQKGTKLTKPNPEAPWARGRRMNASGKPLHGELHPAWGKVSFSLGEG